MFAHDRIIRPYIGDLLVVILIYCFVKSFLDSPVKPTAIGVLVFAYAVEISQYFHLINLLGLENSSLARIILGTSFEWVDLLAYTIGIVVVIILENFFSKKNKAPVEQ